MATTVSAWAFVPVADSARLPPAQSQRLATARTAIRNVAIRNALSAMIISA